MDINKITRIARKVLLAATYRVLSKTSGFGYDGAEKGIIVFNYTHFPILWAYPKNGNVEVVYAKKDSDAYYELCNATDNFGKWLYNSFKLRPRYNNCRNYRVEIWNQIIENGMKSLNGCDYMISSTRTMSVADARKMLVGMFDVSQQSFDSVFGGGEESGNVVFSHGKMEIDMTHSKLSQDEIVSRLDAVKAHLPEYLSSILLYGKVEVRGEFSGNFIADYRPYNDTMRLSEDSNRIVNSMIHELGHRWQNKFMKSNQMAGLKRLYDKCCGKGIELKSGDVIERQGFSQKFLIEHIWLNSYVLKGLDDGDNYYPPKQRVLKGVTSVNGENVKPPFPSKYSKKSLAEFISECFKYAYGDNLTMDEGLKAKFKEIVESE